MHPTFLESHVTQDTTTIGLSGDWVFENVTELSEALEEINLEQSGQINFQCDGLTEIDIAGAWLLLSKYKEVEAQGGKMEFIGFKASHYKFLQHIQEISDSDEEQAPSSKRSPKDSLQFIFETIGRKASSGIEDLGQILYFMYEGSLHPTKLLFKETVRQIYETGIKAIPIVFLISFLMGLVMAYQGAVQLQKFGATIFVVDLVAISVLREMGVILAGIMVAGRSGSAFAAALGVMNLNEETDALRVMGINPSQVLIIPRLLGLIIALPILTVVADIAGLLGGMLICVTVLDISSIQFTERVLSGVGLNTYLVGISKAPVFAVLIASISTLRGMQVKSSAEELGRLTTVAVVQSIFLIIMADGIFAIIFSWYGI